MKAFCRPPANDASDEDRSAYESLIKYVNSHAKRDEEFARQFAIARNSQWREEQQMGKLDPMHRILKDIDRRLAVLEQALLPPAPAPKEREMPDLYLSAARSVSGGAE